MIKRRQLLKYTAGCCTALPLLQQKAFASDGILIYGRDKSDIGTQIATEVLELFKKHGNLDYSLLNYPGKEMQAANEAVAYAEPDGTTMLQAESTVMTLFPHLFKSLPYDPIEDYRPIAIIGETALSLTVGPIVDSNVVNLQDYLDWVIENPEYRNYGCTLYGAEGYLAGHILSRDKRIAIRPQAYARSNAMIRDLLDGSLAAAFTRTGEATQSFYNYDLRPVAITSNERHPQWPTIPTFLEQGVKNMDISGWYGWFLPRDVDESTYQLLKTAFESTHLTDDYQQLLYKLSLKPQFLTEAEIIERIKKENETYKELITDFNLTIIAN